jgi:hypothetical protein
MKIENSVAIDTDEIFRLYASAYQKTKNVVVWPNFDQHLIETELSETDSGNSLLRTNCLRLGHNIQRC